MVKVYDIGMYESALDYLQYLLYRINTSQDLLSDILINKTPEYKYTIENYHHFMSIYKDAKIKYEFEYLDFLTNNIPEFFGSNKHEVDFDFLNGKISFKEKEDTHTNLLKTIELEDSEDIDLLYYMSLDKSVYERILNNVILNRKPNHSLNMEIYNEFIKEYNEIMNQYNDIFYKILAAYAPEYKTDDYYAIVDVNNMTLDIYKDC